MNLCPLDNRGVLRIAGEDRRNFLQGLISNDIELCQHGKPIYAALLTPQGKFLHDIFVVDMGDCFLIDCEVARADDLLQRLKAHKLRAKVTFEDASDGFGVWVGWNLKTGIAESDQDIPSPLREEIGLTSTQYVEPVKRVEIDRSFFYTDPRLEALGRRAILTKDKKPDGEVTDFAAYDRRRLILGVPDGSRDMVIEKSTLLEGNLDQLNGISWSKGCYMGQELTARLHYRALVKKRLFPVTIEGPTPAFGQQITYEGEEIGEMRSSCSDVGLALLSVDKTRVLSTFTCDAAKINFHQPEWMKL